MTFTLAAFTGGTSVTRPAPNTLTTKNPYPTPYVDGHTVSSAWTSQANPALLPAKIASDLVDGKRVDMHIIASGAWQIKFWVLNHALGATNPWIPFANTTTLSGTDSVYDYMLDPGDTPVYVEVVTGTVALYVDPKNSGRVVG